MKDKTGFESYLGSKVLVTETPDKLKIGGKEMDYTHYNLSDDDLVIPKLRGEAEAKSLKCRLWLPDTIGTMDYRSDRLNVDVEKQDDGSYEITRVYIG